MTTSSRLTISLIENTRPASAEKWLSDDDGSRGAGRLAIRIRRTGSRRFYFRYYLKGQRLLIPMGRYSKSPASGFLTLEEAREVAMSFAFNMRTAEADVRKALLSKLTVKNLPPEPSPAREIVKVHPPQTAASKKTLSDLCNAYVEHLQRKGAQSAQTVANALKNHVQATSWAQVPANELTSDDVVEMLRMLVEAGKETSARHLRQYLHAAYNLAKKGPKNAMAPATFREFGVTYNPVSDTASMSEASRGRERPSLSKLELGHIWLGLTDGRHDLSVAVRAIRLTFLLGGQRCLQLLRCRLVDVNLNNNSLTLFDPKGRRRTPRKHMLPLTSEALFEVMALRQMAQDLGNSYLVPGAVKDSPLTSGPMSTSVKNLSDQLLAQKRLNEPFCFANIRSFIETSMAEMEIHKDIRAQIQSHGLGGIQEKHYDQWQYMPQKLKALEAWARYLTEAAELAVAANNTESGRSLRFRRLATSTEGHQ